MTKSNYINQFDNICSIYFQTSNYELVNKILY